MTLFRRLFFLLIFFAPAVPAVAVDDGDVDAAIVKALKFLAKQQRPDGGWEADSGNESTAITSLAVMAFLAAGHVPSEGPYGQIIDRGIGFVLHHQNANGMIVNKKGHGLMYDHGISTLMLAEVAGMTNGNQSEPVRKALEKAVRLILQAQMVPKTRRDEGGWRYQPAGKDSDLSVTAWQLLALRAAKDIGCDVPVQNIDLAVGYVKKCSTGQGFGYQPGNGSTVNMTASGVLALQVCDHHNDDLVISGMEYLQRQPLQHGETWFFYGAYYNAISVYKYGGADWDRTKSHLFEELLPIQEASGSWRARNQNEETQGPVYATSLGVLALSVEYGYLPIYQR